MINFYNQKWLPRKTVAVTIWPFIFYRASKGEVTIWVRMHEQYHYKHQIRWLVIPWFIVYWYYHIKYGYWNNPWEVAARKASGELR